MSRLQSPKDARWLRSRRFTLTLLTLWLAITFGSIWFARDLAEIRLFGSPLAFLLGAQGVMLAYLLLIGFQVWGGEALERRRRRDVSQDQNP